MRQLHLLPPALCFAAGRRCLRKTKTHTQARTPSLSGVGRPLRPGGGLVRMTTTAPDCNSVFKGSFPINSPAPPSWICTAALTGAVRAVMSQSASGHVIQPPFLVYVRSRSSMQHHPRAFYSKCDLFISLFLQLPLGAHLAAQIYGQKLPYICIQYSRLKYPKIQRQIKTPNE